MSIDTKGRRHFMHIGFAVMAIAAFGALIVMIATGVEKVNTGHGLDTYRTFWLVEFNWVAFLVLIAAIVVAMAGALWLRYLEWREVRKLQERYSGGDDDV